VPQVTKVGQVVVPVSDKDTVAFGPAGNDFQPGRPTGILLSSPDPAADRAEFEGLDVDPQVTGGSGGVPVMFSFRDQDKNQLMIVQEDNS
jgi:hypothetical protein